MVDAVSVSCDTPLVCRLALVLIGVGNQRGVRVRVRASASLCIAFGFTLTGLGLLLVCYSQLGGPIGRSQAVRTHASVRFSRTTNGRRSRDTCMQY